MTAADLNNLIVEVLHNRGDDNHPDWSAGSGCLVGDALVLTAAHNVDGPGELLVRVHGTEEHPAVVRLQGDQDVADIALLEITDEDIAVPRCRYGVVNRTLRALIECWAVGFPRFKERSSKEKLKRLAVQVDGVIATVEKFRYPYPWLSLQVTRAPREAPRLHDSEWQGMSGAVVFADDVVVGVISEHHRPEGESFLSVVPITAIDDLIDKDKWWQMLGINRSHLIILPSPEAELRKEGVHVWAEADLRHLHSLREEFVDLSRVFDQWLASEPQKSGQRLRVLWLQGEEGTQEFKREAVRLAQTSGKPIAQVARELGISDSSIHQWRKELAEHGAEAFPGSGHQTALEEENRRLKRELERTRQERDILKKTVSIFSHGQL